MSEKMKILQMIENGEISLDEGIQRINDLENTSAATAETDKQPTRLEILEKLETGEISADEAVNFFSATPSPHSTSKDGKEFDQNEEETDYSEYEEELINTPNIPEKELNRWKRWWAYPLYAGVSIVILSTFWLNSAYQNNGFGFWFFCSWLPLALGLLFIALSWQSRGGPWIHVRVKGNSEKVAISLPAPLGLTSWALRNFGQFIPQLEKTSVDEIILALENTTKNNAPLYVQVDEGENGEKVEVFIG